ncbi:hypothetical protein BUALT_Bualt03G0185600 [Buddleja alternifolia]|uniref:DUF4283 domain-containing protein n=1 Tax=Buddleja alternifolia TaxID=168488 RepID=A0AAV6Y1R4_9LAMI|nr:hypothetical protein BUALT_Bualt03G0185600 [Buddleja alternifolia]
MATPSTADPLDSAAPLDGKSVSYVDKLKSNMLPPELAARSAKKAFIHGVDSNMKQTWYFDGFPMRVLKWTSEFNLNEESPIMPIWIKVFGLRPHWFHHNFLYHIASLIGKSLKLDKATTGITNPMVALKLDEAMTDIANPMVARMCVEVNVLEKLQPDIPIQINDMGLQRNKILPESTSATNAQNTIPEIIMQETSHNLHANLTRPEGLRNNARKMEIDGKKYSMLGLDSPSNSRVLEKSNKEEK